ncbi:hypothetical protein ACFV95_30235, partial [Streptomyces sp. NPDC059893]
PGPRPRPAPPARAPRPAPPGPRPADAVQRLWNADGTLIPVHDPKGDAFSRLPLLGESAGHHPRHTRLILDQSGA